LALATRRIDYSDGQQVFEAHMAWDDSWSNPRPGVLVSHAWRGRSPFEDGKAERLVDLGYVGMALDVYGKGVLGSSPAENAALMQPLLDDRAMLQARLSLALSQLQSQPEVDAGKTAAIGFCFGGLCVLDLARIGADLAGVVSFHGLFVPPGNTSGNSISAKVLALHGWDDPMAKPADVVELAEEMSAMGADWQLHGYGGTLHAFTNPEANDPGNGLQYSSNADQRSWASMTAFLAEVLA